MAHDELFRLAKREVCLDAAEVARLEALLRHDPALAEAVDAYGMTALHVAAIARNVPAVRVLARASSPSSARVFPLCSPLHVARCPRVMHAILDHLPCLASQPAPALGGMFPLHLAAELGYTDVAHRLLDLDADCAMHVDLANCTALHYAVRAFQIETVAALARRCPELVWHEADLPGASGPVTPLQCCVTRIYDWDEGRGRDRVAMALALVEAEPTVLRDAATANYVLAAAAACGAHGAVRELLGRIGYGLDFWTRPHVDVYEGRSPLAAAICGGHLRALDALLAAVPLAALAERDHEGGALVHWVARCKSAALVLKRLARFGIDVGAVDRLGRTALHVAVANRHVKTAQILVEHGCDPTAVDAEGKRAYEYLPYSTAEATLAAFRALIRGVPTNEVLRSLACAMRPVPLFYAIALEASPNPRNLHWACVPFCPELWGAAAATVLVHGTDHDRRELTRRLAPHAQERIRLSFIALQTLPSDVMTRVVALSM